MFWDMFLSKFILPPFFSNLFVSFVFYIYTSSNILKLHIDWKVQGIWSLDRMALDQITRSKVSVNFGTRSNVIFGTGSKV